MNLAGCTKTSGIQCAKHMLDYWKKAGYKLVTTTQAGVKVTRPDFWVVRVSLLGLNQDGVERLIAKVGSCPYLEVTRHTSSTAKYARARFAARGARCHEKKYVNIAGGSSSDGYLKQITGMFREWGFTANLVPGPLLVATTGGKSPAPTLMPLATSTAFAPVKRMLTAAYVAVNRDTAHPDPDLDLRSGTEPKLTTHSLRRGADTSARKHRARSGATESEIDIYFGWNERQLLKAMQVHYASMSIHERMALAKITGWL